MAVLFVAVLFVALCLVGRSYTRPRWDWIGERAEWMWREQPSLVRCCALGFGWVPVRFSVFVTAHVALALRARGLTLASGPPFCGVLELD